MDEPSDAPIRKSVALPRTMWADIAAYRAAQRITTEAEAVRRLIQAAIEAWNGGNR